MSVKPAQFGPEDLMQFMLTVGANADQQTSASLQVLIVLLLLVLMLRKES